METARERRVVVVLVAGYLSPSLLAGAVCWSVSPSADQMGWGCGASWVWGAVKATRLGLGPHRRRLNRLLARTKYIAPIKIQRGEVCGN